MGAAGAAVVAVGTAVGVVAMLLLVRATAAAGGDADDLAPSNEALAAAKAADMAPTVVRAVEMDAALHRCES